MNHIEPERLQRYLAGEADPAEALLVDQHLADCVDCANQLAITASDDAFLNQVLQLDEEELAWIAHLDLTAPVLNRIVPWYRQPHTWLIMAPFIIAGAGLSRQVLGRLIHLVGWAGPVDLGIDLTRSLVRLIVYLSHGGLMVTLWPALLLAGAIWLWKRGSKEERDYA